MANNFSHPRCLCSLGKVAGKAASVIEYLIQVFFKRLDTQPADNKQVGGYNHELVSYVCSHFNFLSIWLPVCFFFFWVFNSHA